MAKSAIRNIWPRWCWPPKSKHAAVSVLLGGNVGMGHVRAFRKPGLGLGASLRHKA